MAKPTHKTGNKPLLERGSVMDPKDRLEKAKKLVDAFKDLGIDSDMDQIFILRLFMQSLFPDLTVKRYPDD